MALCKRPLRSQVYFHIDVALPGCITIEWQLWKWKLELPDGEGSRWVLAGADRGVRLELWKEECCVKRGDSSSKLLLEVWSWLWVKIDSLSECSGSTSSSWNLDPAAGQKFTLVHATDQWRIREELLIDRTVLAYHRVAYFSADHTFLFF